MSPKRVSSCKGVTPHMHAVSENVGLIYGRTDFPLPSPPGVHVKPLFYFHFVLLLLSYFFFVFSFPLIILAFFLSFSPSLSTLTLTLTPSRGGKQMLNYYRDKNEGTYRRSGEGGGKRRALCVTPDLSYTTNGREKESSMRGK